MENMVKITVNGEEHEVEKGIRLLLILSGKGVKIPHLCFHHALVPGASCKLCVVEVKEKNKPPKTRLSCAIKTREGLEITTESLPVLTSSTELVKNSGLQLEENLMAAFAVAFVLESAKIL